MVDLVAIVGPELAAVEDNIAGSSGFTSTVRAWATMACERSGKSSDLFVMQAFAATCVVKRFWGEYGNQRGVEHARWRNQHHFLKWYAAYGGNALPAEYRETLQRHVDSVPTHLVFEPSECVEQYASVMEPACYGRAMFVTANGTLGLAPPSAQPGDSVVWLAGGFCPFVLRQQRDATWMLGGDCYLYDLDPQVLWDDASKLEAPFTLR